MATARQKRTPSPDLTPEEEMAIARVESGKAKIKTYKNADEFLKHHSD
jgi:hypothetical protein